MHAFGLQELTQRPESINKSTINPSRNSGLHWEGTLQELTPEQTVSPGALVARCTSSLHTRFENNYNNLV